MTCFGIEAVDLLFRSFVTSLGGKSHERGDDGCGGGGDSITTGPVNGSVERAEDADDDEDGRDGGDDDAGRTKIQRRVSLTSTLWWGGVLFVGFFFRRQDLAGTQPPRRLVTHRPKRISMLVS